MQRATFDSGNTSAEAVAMRLNCNQSAAGPGPARARDPLEALVTRAVHGDAAAFASLYRRHVAALHRYILFRVSDEATARDLTQDSFIRALRGIGGLEQADRFEAWLFSIAHRTVQNHYRARGRRATESSLDSLDRAQADGQVFGAEAQQDLQAGLETRLRLDALREAIAELSDAQQEVLGLRFVGGLSFAETADVTGRSQHAVRKLQYRGLASLRARMAGDEEARA